MTIVATLLIAGAPAAARAETFYLSSGEVYEGRIVAERDDRYIVAVPRGEIEIPKEDIARIIPQPRPRRRQPAAATVPASVPDPRANIPARLEALAKLGTAAYAERAWVQSVAYDGKVDAKLRVRALETLVLIASGKAILPIAELIGDPEPLVQTAARDLFLKHARPPLSKEIRAALDRHASYGSHRVRHAAISCLSIGDAACEDILARRAREETDEDLRLRVLQALGRMAEPAVVAR